MPDWPRASLVDPRAEYHTLIEYTHRLLAFLRQPDRRWGRRGWSLLRRRDIDRPPRSWP
jgi:hypothetical protein